MSVIKNIDRFRSFIVRMSYAKFMFSVMRASILGIVRIRNGFRNVAFITLPSLVMLYELRALSGFILHVFLEVQIVTHTHTHTHTRSNLSLKLLLFRSNILKTN